MPEEKKITIPEKEQTIDTEKIKHIYDYTKFHIGMYSTLTDPIVPCVAVSGARTAPAKAEGVVAFSVSVVDPTPMTALNSSASTGRLKRPSHFGKKRPCLLFVTRWCIPSDPEPPTPPPALSALLIAPSAMKEVPSNEVMMTARGNATNSHRFFSESALRSLIGWSASPSTTS